MNEKKKILIKEMLFEAIIVFICLFIFTLFFAFCGISMILPINNYMHSTGHIDFKNKVTINSEVNGIIKKVYKKNYDTVASSDPIMMVINREEKNNVSILKNKLRYEKQILQKLEKLRNLGAINDLDINIKKNQIEELKISLAQKSDNFIRSNYKGRIYYNYAPKDMQGDYISKGQKIATIIRDSEKIIRVTFPNNLIDRFPIGTELICKYKDPRSFKMLKAFGKVYKKQIIEEKNTLILYCEITKGIENVEELQPNVTVEVSILINSTSMIEDFLNIDVRPIVKKILPDILEKLIYNERFN